MLRKLFSRSRSAPAITVSEERGVRMLHIGGDAIQSAMRIADPDSLALDYTRSMMAFLLFQPEPREALMIGLGGGSLAKYFHRRIRSARTRAIECDPRVVAVAREQFLLPPDDSRLAVEVGDGTEALAPECCDVLLVDGFVDEAHAPALVGQDFYHAAWAALAGPGVLVVNFMSDDPRLDTWLQRIERAFDGAVLTMPARYDPNLIVFALKGAPPRIEWDTLQRRAQKLEARLDLPFRRYLNALKRMNRHDATHLSLGAVEDAGS
jgi:spermidine synthase